MTNNSNTRSEIIGAAYLTGSLMSVLGSITISSHSLDYPKIANGLIVGSALSALLAIGLAIKGASQVFKSLYNRPLSSSTPQPPSPVNEI